LAHFFLNPIILNPQQICYTKEYFDEGVKVVWQILPYRKIVKVYTSPRQMIVCEAEDMCSATPAVPDFQMTVNQIFQLED
jgi:Uma2 family endonuclease